jgi:hypothetical protein
VAPGTVAPVGSVTVPVTSPDVMDWAGASVVSAANRPIPQTSLEGVRPLQFSKLIFCISTFPSVRQFGATLLIFCSVVPCFGTPRNTVRVMQQDADDRYVAPNVTWLQNVGEHKALLLGATHALARPHRISVAWNIALVFTVSCGRREYFRYKSP